MRACVTPADWKRRSRQPKNTFYYGAGELFDVAAAYAFHIAQAQACLDGNKRTGVAAALMFLKLNGVTTVYDPWKIHEHMIAIAERRSGKTELAGFLRAVAGP